MKVRSLIGFLLLAGGVVVMALPLPAFGHDAAKAQELQRVIERQQTQLDEQRRLLQDLQQQLKSLAGDAGDRAGRVAGEKPPKKPPSEQAAAPSREGKGLSDASKYDRESPTNSNVTYFDPAKAINIPGTNTSVGLHGLAEFQIIHDTVGLNNNRFDTATIPVDGGPSQTKFNVNPTQIHLSSTTAVPEGRLNTMISIDFNGQLDRPEPRLRIAYGEYVSGRMGIGVLGGQAYGTMLDLRAVPETLDFAMPAGLWQLRTPLLRYTQSFGGDAIIEAALESPESVSYLDADTGKLTRWPDLALAGTWLGGGRYLKHLRLSGLARDLGAEGADGSEDWAFGWAVAGSAKVGLPFLGARDNLKLTVHYGDGYGTQLKGGPKEGAFDLVSSELKTIGAFGTYGGIQHFWSDRFRSNLVYGYVNSDNPEFLGGDTYDNTNYTAANFIWTPYKSTTFGVEYLWGRRENKDGESGTSNRLIFSSKYVF
jgi:hypothetical protein